MDPSAPEQQQQIERDRKHKAKNEAHINQKNVKAIHQVYEQLKKSVGDV